MDNKITMDIMYEKPKPKKTFFNKLFYYHNDGFQKEYRIFGIKYRTKNHYKILEQRWYKDHIFLENLKYEIVDEIRKDLIKIPKIQTIDQTLDDIIANKKSVCRFGDGEFYYLIDNEDKSRYYYNQKRHPKLVEKLRMIVKDNSDNITVCLSDFFGSMKDYTEVYQNIGRNQMYSFREYTYEFLDFEKNYGNAFITRPYMALKDKSKAKGYFDKLKQIWDKKDIIVIEGEKSCLGIGNDLFDNTKSVERVICPATGAFDKYDEILEYTKTLPKDKLILIALGMTATVLAYDLAKIGYQAIDIGHIDIEYEWFLMNTEVPVLIKNKYVNDLGHHDVPEFKDNKYESQIIKRIL